MPIPIEKRIERYNAWRKREPVERPMIGLSWEPDVPPLPDMLAQVELGKEVSPDQIQPEMFLDWIESCYQQDCQLQSDVIQTFAPAFGVPWVEAIAGCPVVAHPGSLWAEPCLDSYANRPRICLDLDNPWLRKLIELTRVLVEFADGRFPVTLPLTRGPLDTLSAMRGPERMGLDFYDNRDEVLEILDELTDLWIGFCEAVLPWIPPFHGGYCTRMKMWAPGHAVTPQNDISSIVSASMYEEFALPCDRRIVSRFPYHSFHLHDTEYHQIDGLLKLKELTAIQLFLQPSSGGPPLETVMPVVRQALNSKPLLLGVEDIETAEWCLNELPSTGFCLMLSTKAHNPISEEHKLWLKKHCSF